MQLVWLGREVPRLLKRLDKLRQNSMQPIFNMARRMHSLPNVNPPHHTPFHFCSPAQVQLPLPKETGGGDIVGLVPTWVSARRVLHMLLSAQWHPGLPFTFLITLKFSHMVPLLPGPVFHGSWY